MITIIMLASPESEGMASRIRRLKVESFLVGMIAAKVECYNIPAAWMLFRNTVTRCDSQLQG